MPASNRRIFLAIFLSLLIFFGIRYISLNSSQFKPGNIYAGVSQKVAEIKTKIFSIRLPDFSKIFTLSFTPDNNVVTKQLNDGGSVSFNFPTSSEQNYPSPTSPAITTAGPRPTTRPFPTVKPKPTSIPEPMTPPPITADERPGDDMQEIFEEVNKRTCVPAALLHAFETMESGTGPWVKYNDPPETIKIYNTYGWWKTGAGNPCYGLGYHTQTGIVPSDSINAGSRCMNATGSPDDLAIMGIVQISQWEQDVTRKYTVEILPNNIDRRVLFDNALILAIATKGRVGNQRPTDCDNWPDDIISLAAEKHAGGCQYVLDDGGSVDYCGKILQLYKQYK